MRDGADRRPGMIADDAVEDGGVDELHQGVDTDGDGRPDTVLTDDGADLVVLTDLDGDGFADRTLRIGPDGSVHGVFHVRPSSNDHAAGHAPAHSVWSALWGHLFGS